MTKTISNADDVIDSRDVITRIEELEAELQEVKDAESEQSSEMSMADWLDMGHGDNEHNYRDVIDELRSLKALAEEAEGYAADWHHGETLIRDSYFTEYCQEQVEDCGYISKDFPSWIEIDWEATARNMRMDYTAVEFGNVTYWIR